MTEPARYPTEIRIRRASRALDIAYEDGARFSLPAEYLRVESPSAEVQGHGPHQKQLVTGKRLVSITAADPIGHYAIRLRFDDGHDTGLYTWQYLYQLGEEQPARWAAYLDALRERRATRDP